MKSLPSAISCAAILLSVAFSQTAIAHSNTTPQYNFPVKPAIYPGGVSLRGVNLSGAEFTAASPQADLPNIPTFNDAVYFDYEGANTFRVPFALEFLKPNGNWGQPLDFTTAYAKALVTFINSVTIDQPVGKAMAVILDMHNYMHFNPGNPSADYNASNKNFIGWDSLGIKTQPGNAPNTSQIAAVWSQIATEFAANPHVMFEVMNEPQGVTPQQDLTISNAIIKSIRTAEDTYATNHNTPVIHHKIVLDGACWSGLHSWFGGSSAPSLCAAPHSNASTFIPSKIKDTADNYAIDVHQYFDPSFSGTYVKSCVSQTALQSALNFTQFYKNYVSQNKLAIILGEYGAHFSKTDENNCSNDFKLLMQDVTTHPYAASTGGFLGMTVWSGGHAWGSYLMNVSQGGPANAWVNNGPNDVFHREGDWTQIAPVPAHGKPIMAICNETEKPLVSSSTYGPFEEESFGNVAPNACAYVYTDDNTTVSPSYNPPNPGTHQNHYAEINFVQGTAGTSSAAYLGFGLANSGYGYDFDKSSLIIKYYPIQLPSSTSSTDNACPLAAEDQFASAWDGVSKFNAYQERCFVVTSAS